MHSRYASYPCAYFPCACRGTRATRRPCRTNCTSIDQTLWKERSSSALIVVLYKVVLLSPICGCLQYVRVVHISQDVQRALGRQLQSVRGEYGAPQLEDELPDDGRVGTEAAGHAPDERVVARNRHGHAQQHRHHEKLVGSKRTFGNSDHVNFIT